MLKINKYITLMIIAVFTSAIGIGFVAAQDDNDEPTQPLATMMQLRTRINNSSVMEYLTEKGLTLAQLRDAIENETSIQALVELVGGDIEELRAIVLEEANTRFEERLTQPLGMRMNFDGARLQQWQENRGEMGRSILPFGGRGRN